MLLKELKTYIALHFQREYLVSKELNTDIVDEHIRNHPMAEEQNAQEIINTAVEEEMP